MADSEEIWLDPGHGDAERAARELAQALGMSVVGEGDRWEVGSSRLSDRVPIALRGDVSPNIDARFPASRWPDDWSIFSTMPLVWTVETPLARDRTQLMTATRTAFDSLVTSLAWGAVLTHFVTQVVAAYDPERGLREFPPGTPSDGTGRAVWG